MDNEQKESMESLRKSWEFEFDAWLPIFQSDPVALIISEDYSEPYEMDRAHIFKLENGRFAVVTEEGCSCYGSDDALIDIHPTEEAAMKNFNEWKWKKIHAI